MRPPICDICGKDMMGNDSLGELVYFAKTDADEQWYELSQKPGFVGHPPNAKWICGDHIQQALELKSHTTVEAMEILRASHQQELNPNFWQKVKGLLGIS
ncbi:MAG: hypothetical protein AAF598_03115 [Bacteroidota bacterium]